MEINEKVVNGVSILTWSNSRNVVQHKENIQMP
jgi:hypothetical protein